MPFALGQAIADLFARIAAAISGSGPQAVSPLPPGDDGTPSPPSPVPSPTPTPTPIPEPPVTLPPITPGLPPIVVVPTVPPPPEPLPPTTECPPLSLADQIAIWSLQLRQERPTTTPTTPDSPIITGIDDMGMNFNAVTLLEATDYFRFRAISTSDNVTVSFFGRIRRPNGTIVPFMHQLSTAAPNTLYEAAPVTGAGVLLGAAASVPVGSITSGTVNAIGEIGRVNGSTFVPHTVLFSGQLDDQQALSTTLASPTTPTSRGTFIRVDFPGIAAPDNSVVVTPSSGRQLRILYVSGDYVCSGTAGNRQLTISFAPEGEIMWRGMASQYITASQTGVYRFTAGGQFESPTTALPGSFRQISCPLPESLWFPVAVTVTKSAYGIQAGDTVGGGSVLYEEQ